MDSMVWISPTDAFDVQKYIKQQAGIDAIFSNQQRLNNRVFKAYVGNFPVALKYRKYTQRTTRIVLAIETILSLEVITMSMFMISG